MLSSRAGDGLTPQIRLRGATGNKATFLYDHIYELCLATIVCIYINSICITYVYVCDYKHRLKRSKLLPEVSSGEGSGKVRILINGTSVSMVVLRQLFLNSSSLILWHYELKEGWKNDSETNETKPYSENKKDSLQSVLIHALVISHLNYWFQSELDSVLYPGLLLAV